MGYLLTQVPDEVMHRRATEAARTAGQRAINSKGVEVDNAQGLVVRDLLPDADLDSGDDNGWAEDSGQNEFRQDWATANNADAFNEAYELDPNNNMDNKVIVFYGVQMAGGDVVTREVRFGLGLNGTQGVKAWANVEEVENDEEATGIFANNIVYEAQQPGVIEHWIEDALDGQRFRYLAAVAEPVGQEVSEAQNPLLGNQGGR